MRVKNKIMLSLALLAPFSSFASLKVSPMYIDLGTKKSAEITVESVDSEQPLDVQFSSTKKDGERARGYLIYPPIIKGIKAGEKRTVRVIRKNPTVEDNTYVEVKALNESYKVTYKLLIIDGAKSK